MTSSVPSGGSKATHLHPQEASQMQAFTTSAKL